MNDSLVIIPTYNEKENIKDIILKIFSLEKSFDILIIDDNSPDGTGEIVKAMMDEFSDADKNKLFLIEREEKSGLGTAYIEGFRFSLERDYQFIFEMDADFSHNPHDLILLYNTCKIDGFDVAIGSRYVRGVNVVNWPLGRILLSLFASYYVRTITRMPVKDSTAGFKCYRREVLQAIPLDEVEFIGYAFQIEMKFIAWKLGFKLKEVPIIFTNRTRGESKMSTKIFNEALFGVFKMKIKSLFKKYRPN